MLFPAVFNVADLDGTNGFRIRGTEATGDETGLGWSVDLVGDVNGDGLADILFSNPGQTVGGLEMAGSAFVRFERISH